MEVSMKYEMDINLEFENTMTLMINEIDKGSVVLEFGPASGRLTRYLKEKCDCKMYIVELDEEAGRIAAQYAEDAVIGDIEKYEWLERFAGIRFDYILFADVLEHLYNPEKVLESVKNILKPNGYVIMSLPNIAHNSVIIDLLDNKFEYRPTGLLDNTHIKFWTYSNIENMLKKLKYNVDIKYATYTQVGFNEFDNSYEDLKNINPMALKSREMGEIYQFVYKITLNEENARGINKIDSYSDYYYNQYFFDGNEIKKEILIADGRKYVIETDIPKEVKKLRLNPLNKKCIIEFFEVKAYKDGQWRDIECESSNSNFKINNFYVFDNDDPQIYYIVEECDKIRIEYSIVEGDKISNHEVISEIEKRIDTDRITIEQKENYIGEQRDKIGSLESDINDKNDIIRQKDEEINRLVPYFNFINNHYIFRKFYNLVRKLRRKHNEGK